MEEEFVPYDMALKMKALGFDKPCIAWYNEDGKFMVLGQEDPNFFHTTFPHPAITQAPTFSQAFRWFRKEYGLDSFCRQTNLNGRSYYKISKIETDEIIKGYSNFTKSYEDAELACLDKLIELVELKRK